MHELGIMTGVAEAVERAAKDAGATAVLGISLEVGEMTEAIPDALFFAFEVLQETYPLLEHCALKVNMVKPHSRCLECGAEYDHDRFHMLCPECNSPFTELMRGKELRIESLEVDIPDEDEDETDGSASAKEDDAASPEPHAQVGDGEVAETGDYAPPEGNAGKD